LENCENKFEKYQWLNEFSKGAFGFIYQVFNKILNKKTLLKVQIYRSRSNLSEDELMNAEMKISCLVSELPNFVKLLDYWICDIQPVDEIWKTSKGKDIIEEDMENNSEYYDWGKEQIVYRPKLIFYLEMEQYEGTLANLYDNSTITDYDKCSFFFEMLYSLMNAFKQLGFHHNDIHSRNVFYLFNNEEREYTIEIKDYSSQKKKNKTIICKSIFVPIWGDFGFSKVNKKYEANIVSELINMLDIWKFSDELNFKKINTNEELLQRLGDILISYDSNKKRKIK
jgi:serine/threonine protein kinase